MAILRVRPLRIGWPPVLIRSAQGGGPGPEPDPAGQLRAATPRLTRGIVLGGHSSLQPSNYDGILAAAVGPVILDFGQSSEELWNNNGPARARPEYDMLIVSESDSYGEPLYTGIPDPESAEGLNNLQHLYWLGLEAKNRGAEFAIFNSPSARSTPVDDTNRVRMNYYRQWLQAHLDMPVWVVPGGLYVEELRGRGLTDDQIFSDSVHLRDGAVSRGAAYQAVAFVTGALPAGIASGDQLYADAALSSIRRYWWSGLGGSEFGQSLDIADPLPAPRPRPGEVIEPEPEPADGILWTAQGYEGPELTGNQPVITDNVMTFDGTGLLGDYTTAGFYTCMAIRTGSPSADGYLMLVSPDASNIWADPLHAVRSNPAAGIFGAERYPAPGEMTIRPHTPDWVVLEMWVIGAGMGGFDGEADVVNTLDSSAPVTPQIALFGIGQPLECSYLRITKEMPGAEQRAAYRAAAEATIPQEAL